MSCPKWGATFSTTKVCFFPGMKVYRNSFEIYRELLIVYRPTLSIYRPTFLIYHPTIEKYRHLPSWTLSDRTDSLRCFT
ncbi:hypothetical protein ACIQ57_09115 [Lysinibacillus xylanilyticus]|uniref:hypothetical protein n=1 Tax=Lysinibacillus xylanilyticus TaxID=582475 RepID=UPI0037F9946F